MIIASVIRNKKIQYYFVMEIFGKFVIKVLGILAIFPDGQNFNFTKNLRLAVPIKKFRGILFMTLKDHKIIIRSIFMIEKNQTPFPKGFFVKSKS